MDPILRFVRTAGKKVTVLLKTSWRRFRSLPLWAQIGGVLVLLALIVGVAIASGKDAEEVPPSTKTVTLATLSELESGTSGASIIGTIRSISEADILAQNGGTVKNVNTRVGAVVPAGFVIASLDNSTEAAQVLQAQGAYDSAIAGQRITGIQAGSITRIQTGSAQTSLSEAQAAARTAARSAYTTLDTTLTANIDTVFGADTPSGPDLLINPGPTQDLDRKRDALDTTFEEWRARLSTANSRDPKELLDDAFKNAERLRSFLNEIVLAINDSDNDTRATSAQRSALSTARADIDAQLSAISNARSALNASKTTAKVGDEQLDSSDAEQAGASASVKQALGSLHAAQAAYEKTIVRAPIGGTVNFLPIRVGDYVMSLMHVATVAQNGALEIVAYVSEDDRQDLTPGMKLAIEGGQEGVVTSIAPALDPVTQQIEVHIAVEKAENLVNGQTVRITLPSTSDAALASAEAAITQKPVGPALIPLTALKLTSSARVVFSVGDDGRLVAHPVEIGDVRGDRIEVITPIPADLRIVTDARGLSEGQKVTVASAI